MSGQSIILVTGANRGIGLEFARQLSRRGDIVIAGYRDAQRSRELLAMAADKDNVFAVQVDATSPGDLIRLRDFIDGKFGRLDQLINNGGINVKYSSHMEEIETDDLMESFRVNVVGPFLTVKILRPLLLKGQNARIINITSQLGSIEQSAGGAIPYRISKAALNMLSKNQAFVHRKDRIITVALHPGWVRTDMGGPNAPLSVDESVTQMLKVIDDLAPKDNGTFLGYDGRTKPF